jgi:hypothetical protein
VFEAAPHPVLDIQGQVIAEVKILDVVLDVFFGCILFGFAVSLFFVVYHHSLAVIAVRTIHHVEISCVGVKFILALF